MPTPAVRLRTPRPSRSVLMIASEALPYSKTGGLADVLGALPGALARLGWQVTLVTPRYRAVTAGTLVERSPVRIGAQLFDVGYYEETTAEGVRVVLLDVRGLCSYCNYQLVVSGRSDRQVDAISEGIIIGMRDEGVRALSHEGKRSGQWALLDFGDVIVHVFHHPAREHYDLEGLWIDAPRVPIEVPADARVAADEY